VYSDTILLKNINYTPQAAEFQQKFENILREIFVVYKSIKIHHSKIKIKLTNKLFHELVKFMSFIITNDS
jgi:triphosphoribosyl-dephospho-CoA synthetase